MCVGRNDFFFNGLRRYAGLVRIAVVVGGGFQFVKGIYRGSGFMDLLDANAISM